MESSIRWSSRTSFIFAAAAAAIGLGNVWRFSYLAGQNGGGAFVCVYLICVVVLGLPLLMSEIVIGRLTRKNPVLALADLAKQSQASACWRWLGAVMILIGFLILTYYIVIVGWVMDYTLRAILGDFIHLTEKASAANFTKMQSSHWQMLLTDTLVVLAAMATIVSGVKEGLERAVKIIFPLMFILMAFLLVYALRSPGASEGIRFLFYPDFSHLTGHSVLIALGQAFFSLGIAMGVTLMFSAYLPENLSILECAVGVTLADTGFALLSGLIIFPIVFSFGMQPTVGPSLIFQTLPLAFSQMEGGQVISILFFIMLFFAAFSSVIALLEPAVCWLSDLYSISRGKAVCAVSVSMWLVSLLVIGSFSHPHIYQVAGSTIFTIIDNFSASILLPIAGILLSIFVGWLLPPRLLQEHLQWDVTSVFFRLWRFILRYVAPVSILLILLSSVGLL